MYLCSRSVKVTDEDHDAQIQPYGPSADLDLELHSGQRPTVVRTTTTKMTRARTKERSRLHHVPVATTVDLEDDRREANPRSKRREEGEEMI